MGEAGNGVDETQFLDMPLLLLRMPAPLKAVMAEFLATEFDCRVSALRLGTRSMVRSWEGWIRTAGLPTRGALAKDVVITLGFYIPPPEQVPDGEEDEEEGNGQLGLKSIDVFIPAAELRKFVDAGADSGSSKRKSTGATWEDDVAKRRKLAGRLHEEGWEWRRTTADEEESSPLEEQHFTEALGRYIDKHLGLNLFHPGVRITKIACGGFVISEGRIKVFAPADLGEGDSSPSPSGQRAAVCELLTGMVEKAAGEVKN
ncbi:centromere subunit L [Cercophora newfieldiana]|uniref:Centromere subunit L n=1 Tax=Cercophora newfieldiana TaxID=92897 RepID=A0AA39XXL1_9PEZI|nr:centromere subunit L [Cercophora newfieldiana]